MSGPEILTSRQNPLLSQLVKLQNSRRLRQKEGLFVGDGTKLLEEAVKWYPQGLKAVVLREGVTCPALPQGVRLVQVSAGLMDQISTMEAPEGALFLCALPPEEETELQPGTLVLDGIQDPGNVGTILRTADAFQVPVVLTEGCADPYNPKTVRATMGAIFRTTPGRLSREDLIFQCREKQIPLLATALSDSAYDIRRADLKGAAVVIGSEGRGVSAQLLDASQGQVIIPMNPKCESLNAAVAASIALWQMTGL